MTRLNEAEKGVWLITKPVNIIYKLHCVLLSYVYSLIMAKFVVNSKVKNTEAQLANILDIRKIYSIKPNEAVQVNILPLTLVDKYNKSNRVMFILIRSRVVTHTREGRAFTLKHVTVISVALRHVFEISSD